ncbi:unnamed protein product, partial [Ascophyllum nodosum]
AASQQNQRSYGGFSKKQLFESGTEERPTGPVWAIQAGNPGRPPISEIWAVRFRWPS